MRDHSDTRETGNGSQGRNEHEDRVQLTLQDIEKGDKEKARKWMNDGDGGLLK